MKKSLNVGTLNVRGGGSQDYKIKTIANDAAAYNLQILGITETHTKEKSCNKVTGISEVQDLICKQKNKFLVSIRFTLSPETFSPNMKIRQDIRKIVVCCCRFHCKWRHGIDFLLSDTTQDPDDARDNNYKETFFESRWTCLFLIQRILLCKPGELASLAFIM